ncbi:MAG: pyruvate dehydrogenase (acetyl-transferring) E1 component subunit alpha [Alphaproteobacteria bacterium]
MGPRTFNTAELIKAYESMLLIRRFEERSAQLYGMGLIAGFCHLYSGQEAVVTGLQACANPQDTVITSYRDHGHMLACGMEANGVMAELLGRATGYSKGKGGSMHMFSREKNFFGGHGIVGAQVSIGTGMAFAHKYNADGGLCWAYLGDGAVNQGQVYESFNMAALWKLPVVYVIEDNEYSMGTSVARSSASPHFSKRGEAYGIPGREVDGMDLMAVREAGEWAAALSREGEGPVLLHMKTYRYRGHSMSDPAKYRTREEVEKVRENRDPIERLKHYLVDAKLADEAGLLAIDKRVKEVVAAAVTFAQDSPEPDAAELYTDIIIEN